MWIQRVEYRNKQGRYIRAGANIIIADGTTNVINGSYVAKIYDPKTIELSSVTGEVLDAKKPHKYDAAVYFKMTMNVGGEDSVSPYMPGKESQSLSKDLTEPPEMPAGKKFDPPFETPDRETIFDKSPGRGEHPRGEIFDRNDTSDTFRIEEGANQFVVI